MEVVDGWRNGRFADSFNGETMDDETNDLMIRRPMRRWSEEQDDMSCRLNKGYMNDEAKDEANDVSIRRRDEESSILALIYRRLVVPSRCTILWEIMGFKEDLPATRDFHWF